MNLVRLTRLYVIIFLCGLVTVFVSPRVLCADEIEIETTDLISGDISTETIPYYDEDSTFPFSPGYLGNVENDYSPNRIIIPDDRTIVENTTRVPYRFIGKIYYTNNLGNTCEGGTGFLVGQNIVLTAAHCAYHKGNTIKSLTFIPGLNGSVKPYGEYTVTKVHVPKLYKNEIEIQTGNEYTPIMQKYDYAVLELDRNAGVTLGYFGLGGYGSSYNRNNLEGKNVTVAGYPKDKGGKLYRHKAAVESFNAEGYLIFYSVDTEDGQSGSPVIFPIQWRYYVVGIHTSAYSETLNRGRYITKNIVNLVNKYK